MKSSSLPILPTHHPRKLEVVAKLIFVVGSCTTHIPIPLRIRARAYPSCAGPIVGMVMEGEIDNQAGLLLLWLLLLRKALGCRVYVALEPFARRVRLRDGIGRDIGTPVCLHPAFRELPEPDGGTNYWSIIRILYRKTMSGVVTMFQLRTVYRPPIGVDLPRAMVMWNLDIQRQELDWDQLDIG